MARTAAALFWKLFRLINYLAVQTKKELLEIRELLIGGWKFVLRYKLGFLSAVGIAAATAFLIWPHDPAWLQIIRGNTDAPQIARQLSYWGDFLTGTAILVIALWLAGKIFKKPHWRRTAITCLLAAAIAGASVNCFRLTLGRPRPSAQLADGFYGLQTSADYHGFPSGHAATAFGTATALGVAMPPLAAPAMTAAAGVAWARMRLNRHYPSDILVGAAFGIFFGLTLGAAARLRKPPQ